MDAFSVPYNHCYDISDDSRAPGSPQYTTDSGYEADAAISPLAYEELSLDDNNSCFSNILAKS
jgi:hypothetical protein